MYELLVLALLMHWPLHAYKIAKIANNILGPEENMSRGTLSSLLSKLEQARLVTEAAPEQVPFPSDRPSRVLAITLSGRKRFYQLMLDTTSHPGTYRKLFHIKALHLEFLPLEQQLFLVEHYLHSCQRFIDNKQTEMQAFTRSLSKQEHMSSEFREGALTFMQLKIEQWKLELAWVQSLHQRIIFRLKQHGEDVFIAEEGTPDSRL